MFSILYSLVILFSLLKWWFKVVLKLGADSQCRVSFQEGNALPQSVYHAQCAAGASHFACSDKYLESKFLRFGSEPFQWH